MGELWLVKTLVCSDRSRYVYPGESHKSPSVRLSTITFRNDAILPVSCPGRITDETVSQAFIALRLLGS